MTSANVKHLSLNNTGSGEDVFIKKTEKGTISLHIGYTECELTVKETKELIQALKDTIQGK